MTFSYKKQKGDLLKSEDWNSLTAEVERLGKEKLERNQDDTFKGSLTVEGALSINNKTKNSPILVVNKDGNVGIGTTNPSSKLDIQGNVNVSGKLAVTGELNINQSLAVGDFLKIDINSVEKSSLTLGGVSINRFNSQLPLEDDNKSISTQSVIKKYVDNIAASKAEKGGSDFQDFMSNKLTVKEIFFKDEGQISSNGNIKVTGKLIVTDDLNVSKSLTVNKKITVGQDNEISFADNGQIRSFDDNHKIVFDRKNDKLKLIEVGEIQLLSKKVSINEEVVVTGIEKLRIIRGRVSSGTSTDNTQSYSINYGSDNLCKVFFTKNFSLLPAIVATQESNGNTLDNVIVYDISQSGFTAKCGDSTGNKPERRTFSFIAIG